MNRKRRALIMLVAALLIITCAGCQTAGVESGASQASSAPAVSDSSVASEQSEATPAEATIEINNWTGPPPGSTASEDLARERRIADFLRDFPNVEYTNNTLAHDDYVVKIKALMAADDLPDVFTVRGDMLETLIGNGQIRPAQEYLDMQPGWEASFGPGAFDNYTLDSVKWGIPKSVHGWSYLFANTELLAECGVDKVPETLAELKDAVVKIRAKGYIPIAMGNVGKSVIGDCLMSAICDRYTGSEWFFDIKFGKGGSFTDPEFVQALQTLYDLAQMGAFNEDLNSLDQDQGMMLYASRKAAMTINGSWETDWIEKNCDPELVASTKVALPPSVEGGKGDPSIVVGGAGWAYQINAKAEGKKLETLVEFLKYQTDETYVRYCIEEGFIRFPTVPPADADFSNIKSVTQQYIDLQDVNIYGPSYYVLLDSVIIEEFGNVCQELAVNSIEPQAAAERVQKAYEQYLKDRI